MFEIFANFIIMIIYLNCLFVLKLYHILPSHVKAILIAKYWQSDIVVGIYKSFKMMYNTATMTSALLRIVEKQLQKEKSYKSPSLLPTIATLIKIDHSLLYSKELHLERSYLESNECSILELSQAIAFKKGFPGKGAIDSPHALILYHSLFIIHRINQALYEIDTMVNTKYDRNNKAHEIKLMLIWDSLSPDTLSSRKSNQWLFLGFQGEDPSTDFRGMGAFALDQLHYFCTRRTDDAKVMLTASHHPISWFSMALVCINMSAFIVELLNTRRLHPMLYVHYLQLITPKQLQFQSTLPIHVIHDFYCVLNMEFLEKWQSQNQTVIQFESFYKEFKDTIKQEMKLSYLKYLIKP